ncbi:MmcQ/YjbR family DNA-binding protein [Mucilaginibacter ginsenosidivorans]|uniref:MmcQ/YjbR family DNA-binding protein n=1 Tax=Mucilaginibacter ginsenosidivorans TaxID=398053 RepID=UPI001651F132|nr:MmcQ/YjbR family DNA-binding protein [Mucilaginibacter ginsenosidivorans]
MTDLETARKIVLAQPETEEFDHFGRPAFRIKKKRVFATLWPAENRMMVKLTPIDQSVFNSFDPAIFYPVQNKWGLDGATFVELSKVRLDMLEDVIHTAWETANTKPTKNKKL